MVYIINIIENMVIYILIHITIYILQEISHTIVNALSIVSGIVCDGAKASCAAKIAAGVEAEILSYYMYKEGQQFRGGDGIVKKRC